MTLVPISVACPKCGSANVLYSCKPECCFNHVCGDCYTTFELSTTRVGEMPGLPGELPPNSGDTSRPTAPCARCGEWILFALDEGPTAQLVCVACKALLTLNISEINT